MTDEEYIFRQDCAEKKRIGHGDRNKKRGGGRYVRTPSDNLTRKERLALNGEVKSYNITKPMTWEEYKDLPTDLAQQYLNWMQTTFGASYAHISEMMGTSKGTLASSNKGRGITSSNKFQGKRPVFRAEEWNNWLIGNKPAKEADVPKPAEANPVEEKTPVMAAPEAGAMSFEGEMGNVLITLLQTVGAMLGDKRCRVSIDWEVCHE